MSKYQGRYCDCGMDHDNKEKTPHLLPWDFDPSRVRDLLAGAGAAPPVLHYPVSVGLWCSRAWSPVESICQRCQGSKLASGDLTLQIKTRSVQAFDIKGGVSGWNRRDGGVVDVAYHHVPHTKRNQTIYLSMVVEVGTE